MEDNKANLRDALVYPLYPHVLNLLVLTYIAVLGVFLYCVEVFRVKSLSLIVFLYIILYFRKICQDSWDRKPDLPLLWKINPQEYVYPFYVSLLTIFLSMLCFFLEALEAVPNDIFKLFQLALIISYPMIIYSILSAESLCDMKPSFILKTIVRNKRAYAAMWVVVLVLLGIIYALVHFIDGGRLFSHPETGVFQVNIISCVVTFFVIYAWIFIFRYLTLLHRDGK